MTLRKSFFGNGVAAFLRKISVSQKFSTDVIWNIASFGIMGITGILLNIIIARYYNAAVLGVFNQVYAIYILLSQVAVGGIHLSVLKNIAQLSEDASQASDIFSSGLLLTALTAGVVTIVVYLLRDIFGMLLDSNDVSVGMCYALPGLFIFALNKVFLSLINGFRYMKAFAVFQALRFILMLVFLVLLIAGGTEGNQISRLFFLSEAGLLALVLPYSLKFIRIRFSGAVLTWAKKHLVFGLKAAGGNILLDVNSRVDVIILGFFASDSIVGIYSFAAMLADGFNQLPVVIRGNINPIITQILFNRGERDLERAVNRGKKIAYLFLSPIGFIAIMCFPIITVFNARPEYAPSWGLFAILMAGILLSMGYSPFQMILNQAGYPGYQTLLIVLIFSTNVMLNLLLIPTLGMYGSALATASTFVLQIIYLKALTYTAIGIRI